MKLYTKQIDQPLPDWAIIVSEKFGLFELEINDNHPDFQSLFNRLTSEIQPGVVGVKSADLCLALVTRCGSIGLIVVEKTSIFM